ncbi:MAG: ADP-glyceromanno-heptose 6-epimerase [Verrucomicrobia bacterium]|jgi:ADP-L-glycero-D-manno-heptose 6-epimerase|nr:MAG: ADP-glyceromanno-heptose 6-epimerase [Verrucomicrobiota bacterium]
MSALDGKILVTGGAGFIGSALIWALNERGHKDIIVTDFLGSDEKWRNLTPLKFSDYVEAGTFRSTLAGNPKAYGKFSAVFHLGACSATTERNASYLVDNNFAVTKELASWSLAQGSRFIYASSAATYGDGNQGMDDKNPNIESFRPLNMYGYSKQMFDVYAKHHGWLDQIVGLKYFNIFGPNEDHKADMRSVVHKAFQQIKTTSCAQLFKSYHPDYKDGEQKRDFLYVKDAIAMTLHFAEKGLGKSGLYNIGSGEANTWLSLTNAIFAALDMKPQINFIDMPEILKEKYQYFTQADTSKLKSSGYTHSATPLVDSVKDYVQNYLAKDKRLGA